MIDDARLDRLFAAALERPADERAAFITAECAGDAELAAELGALLRAHEAAAGFLDDAAPWLAGMAPVGDGSDGSGTGGPWLGRTLSHYEVLEPIAAGGMGVVFKARDTKLDRPVTLKFLHPYLRPVPTVTMRFVQEAKAASALDHPNICTIYEIDETPDGQVFIAMAYYAGETLKERLSRGPLPLAESLAVARAIAAGLERAHEAGIVHRDIKPANVMLTERGEVKILDFGIAKLEGAAEITGSGARLGTVGYMSPEQVEGDPVDHRTDVWSLGVVLVEMLAGARPFAGDNDAALVRAIVGAEPVIPTDLPADVARVVRAALAKAPADRLGSMAAFRTALDALSSGHPPPALPAAPASRRRRVRRVGAGLLVIAAAIVAGLTLGPDRRPAPTDAIPRLVVLPFENLGPAEHEYFADGITDEIVTRLAKVRGLAVLARQSSMQYKGSTATPEEIGQELSVDYVLEATISWDRPLDGPDRVRVRPQLVRVSDGTYLWADTYQGELATVFQLQSEMAQRIVAALDVTLLEPERRALVARPTGNLKAYDHFLRGNHYLLQRSRESVTRAIGEYEAALALDSGFADAQARIAYALGLYADWGWEYPGISMDSLLSWGFATADRALELNPQSADAWMARAYLLAFRNPDTYEGVDQAFRQALTYDPNNAEAYHQYASMMIRLPGRADAEAYFHRALALEPKLAVALVNLGFFKMAQGQPAEAFALFDSAVAIDPLFAHAYEHRAHARIHTGQLDEARSDAESAIDATDGALGRSILALVAARSGDTAEAHRILAELRDQDVHLHKEGRSWVAATHIALGEYDRALDLLEHERHVIGLVYLRFLTRAPDFDPIRDNPRFRRVLEEDEEVGRF